MHRALLFVLAVSALVSAASPSIGRACVMRGGARSRSADGLGTSGVTVVERRAGHRRVARGVRRARLVRHRVPHRPRGAPRAAHAIWLTTFDDRRSLRGTEDLFFVPAESDTPLRSRIRDELMP